MNPKKIIAIIPARYESTRLPFKLLREFQGKSLLQRTYENVKNIDLFDEVVIATDSPILLEHTRTFTKSCVITPPCSSGSERAAKAVELYPHLQGADAVFNMQGDHPLVSRETVERIITKLNEDPFTEVATGVVVVGEEAAHSPSAVKCVFDNKGNALYFSRSPIPYQRSQKKIYYQHIGIYGFSTAFLLQYPKLKATPLQEQEDLEQLKILEHGFSIKVALCEEIPMGIDTLEDAKKFEELLCNR